MLGDYVINTEFGKNEIAQVEIVEPTRVWLKGGKTYVPITYIEPVPITVERLEKNGFKEGELRSIHGCPKWEDISIDTKLYPAERVFDGRFMLEIDAHFKHVFICIKHFHELQHALRVCGIEKEIKL